ncbi:MAG: hypothetical protein KDK70_38050 [Myxococcales bacterium]|nr:hypothetical protein [Myxococcales bacterium]
MSDHARGRASRVAGVLGVVLGALGCNERPVDDDPVPAEVRAYAQQRCLRIEQCACPNATHEDRAECEARLVAVYQEEVQGREGIELSCFAAGAELWRTASCDEPPDDVPCSVLLPLAGEGATCSIDPFGDAYVHAEPCAEGLVCFDQTCRVPVQGGRPGDGCTPDGRCSSALTCIAGRCEVPPGEGGSCDVSWNCEPQRDLYCAEGICTPRKSAGDGCSSDDECHLGVPCVEARCTPIEPRLCLRGGEV